MKPVFYAIGQDTQTIYAKGYSKAECLRKLNKKYPSFENKKDVFGGRASIVEKVLPESVKIMRGK